LRQNANPIGKPLPRASNKLSKSECQLRT
jgi:hypothetical protein